MLSAAERLRHALMALQGASSFSKHRKAPDCMCEACYAAYEIEQALSLWDAVAKLDRNPSSPSHFTLKMAERVLGEGNASGFQTELHFGEAMIPAHKIIEKMLHEFKTQYPEVIEAREDFFDSFGVKSEMKKR